MPNRPLLIATLTAIAIAIGLALFPAISDDLWFTLDFRDGINSASDFLSRALNSIIIRCKGDNARLANMIMVLCIPLPRIIPIAISAAATFLILLTGASLANCLSRPVVFPLWITLFLILFPWIDQLYILDFQMNYIWGTALSLTLLHLMLSPAPKLKLLIPTAILTGFWHEGFSGPILFLSILLFIIYRSRKYILTALLLLPGLITLCIPKFSNFAYATFSTRISVITVFLIPLLLFIILLTINLLRSKTRTRLNPALTTSLLFLSLSSCTFMYLYPLGPRTGTLGITTSLIGICYLIPPLPKKLKNLRIPTAILLYALIIIHLTLVDLQCARAGETTRKVIRTYQSQPLSTQYADLTLRPEAPLLCFQKPYYDWFAHLTTTTAFTLSYGSPDTPLRVVPAPFLTFTPEKSQPIPGTARLRRFRNLLVGPAPSTRPAVIMLETTDSRGRTTHEEYYTVPLQPRHH